jgi:hypothetical protein
MKKMKLLALCAGGVLGLTQAANAQFVDNCVDATTPYGTGTYTYDLSFATNDAAGTCGATGTAQDMWIRFVPAVSDTVTVETCGLVGADSVLEAWDSCGGFVIACNDDFCGLQSTIQFFTTAGVPVFIRVADFAGGTHAGSVRIFFQASDIQASGAANPDTINQGGSTTFEVTVTPASSPPSTGIAATIDLSQIGGSASQQLFDDGSNGDAFPGDNIFSYAFTTSGSVSPGAFALPFNVTDAQSRNANGTAALTILPPAPGNDDCANALNVTAGSYPFDSSSATTDGSASCGGSGTSDIWFRYTPAANGIVNLDTCGSSFDTVLSVLDGCGGFEMACNDDFCGLSSRLSGVPVSAGVPIYIRVARYFSGQGGPGVLNISVPTPPQWDETVDGGGDAGNLPSTAQTPTGTNPFTNLNGNIPNGGDADMYLINICDSANFSASTTNADTAGDTQLWIFNEQGLGVTFNDDNPSGGTLLSVISSSFIPGNGNYYLAVSRYNTDPVDEGGNLLWNNTPFNVERTPDGPGAFSAVAAWLGSSGTGSYRVNMTGVCFAGGNPPCDPDMNQDGNVDQDDVAYLINVVGGGPNPTNIDPDFNQDGNVDQDDVAALINVVAGGPCP